MKNSENQRDGYLSTHIFIWLVVWNSPGPKSCQRVGPRWPILGWLGLPFDSLLPWMRSLLHKPDSRLEFTLSLRSLACIVRWLGQSVACCLWRCCWPWTWLLQGGRSRQCLLLAWSEHVLVGRVSVGTSSCARICEDAMDGHCLHANFVRVCKPASYAWPSFLLSQCCGDWSSDASTVCFFSNFGRPPTHWKLQACCQLWLLQGWPAHPFLQCLLLRCLLWRERASVGKLLGYQESFGYKGWRLLMCKSRLLWIVVCLQASFVCFDFRACCHYAAGPGNQTDASMVCFSNICRQARSTLETTSLVPTMVAAQTVDQCTLVVRSHLWLHFAAASGSWYVNDRHVSIMPQGRDEGLSLPGVAIAATFALYSFGFVGGWHTLLAVLWLCWLQSIQQWSPKGLFTHVGFLLLLCSHGPGPGSGCAR